MQLQTLENFAGRLNEVFEADVDQGRTSFVLVEARLLQEGDAVNAIRAPFVLVFRNVSSVLFPQQIFQMENSTLGGLEIFLVPVARDADGFLYEAVFN